MGFDPHLDDLMEKWALALRTTMALFVSLFKNLISLPYDFTHIWNIKNQTKQVDKSIKNKHVDTDNREEGVRGISCMMIDGN